MQENTETSSVFSFPPTLKCPVCGNEETTSLGVSYTEFKGEYCMKCWAKWISENIPKMEKKVNQE